MELERRKPEKPTKSQRKTRNAILTALEEAQDSIDQDQTETRAWQKVFLAFENGSTRVSLTSHVQTAQQIGEVAKSVRTSAEEKLERAIRWIGKLQDGYNSHKRYVEEQAAEKTHPSPPSSPPSPSPPPISSQEDHDVLMGGLNEPELSEAEPDGQEPDDQDI